MVLLDGVYVHAKLGGARVFHPAPTPSAIRRGGGGSQGVHRMVRCLKERGLLALTTAPGDDDVTVTVGDETFGEDDPLLAQLLAAATADLPPAGPAERRAPLRLALSGNAQPLPKGRLCAEHWLV